MTFTTNNNGSGITGMIIDLPIMAASAAVAGVFLFAVLFGLGYSMAWELEKQTTAAATTTSKCSNVDATAESLFVPFNKIRLALRVLCTQCNPALVIVMLEPYLLPSNNSMTMDLIQKVTLYAVTFPVSVVWHWMFWKRYQLLQRQQQQQESVDFLLLFCYTLQTASLMTAIFVGFSISVATPTTKVADDETNFTTASDFQHVLVGFFLTAVCQVMALSCMKRTILAAAAAEEEQEGRAALEEKLLHVQERC